jgi:hypothetical protein
LAATLARRTSTKLKVTGIDPASRHSTGGEGIEEIIMSDPWRVAAGDQGRLLVGASSVMATPSGWQLLLKLLREVAKRGRNWATQVDAHESTMTGHEGHNK